MWPFSRRCEAKEFRTGRVTGWGRYAHHSHDWQGWLRCEGRRGHTGQHRVTGVTTGLGYIEVDQRWPD